MNSHTKIALVGIVAFGTIASVLVGICLLTSNPLETGGMVAVSIVGCVVNKWFKGR